MKVRSLVTLVLIMIILASCSNINKNNISDLSKEIKDLQKKNERLINEVSELKRTNDDLSKSLNEELVKNKIISDEIKQEEKDVKYIDTIVEGKETFTTYENLIKNFGNPKKVKNIIDKHNVYIHGHFAILVYDNIEFVINCSGNENDPFFIKDCDSVCRVDITGDKYILDRSYFNGIKIGDSAQEIAKHYKKEIIKVNYEGWTDMDIVVKNPRDDLENFKYGSGIYFSGDMDTGLALGIVLLINDENNVARIIMGYPTAG